MAEIIQLEIVKNKEIIKNCLFNYDNEYRIRMLLNEKGGNSFSFTIIDKTTNEILTEYSFSRKNYEEKWEKFKKKLSKILRKWEDKYEFKDIIFVFYSRQVFETENFENVKPASYLENNKYIWMTGNITNLDEIEKALGKKFTDPSQAIAYCEDLLKKNIIIKGIFTALVYDLKLKKNYWIHNGISIWKNLYKCGIGKTEDKDILIWTSTNSNIKNLSFDGIFKPAKLFDTRPYYLSEYLTDYIKNPLFDNIKENIYMIFNSDINSILTYYSFIKDKITDITGDLLEYILVHYPFPSDESMINYIFVYFDYGSKTSKQEIAAMKKFYNFIKEEFPNYKFEYRIVDVKNLFKEFNKITNYSNNHNPYQNTEIAILLSDMINKDLKKEIFIPYIVFSSNLNKSYSYLNHNSLWFEGIKNIINYNGDEYKCVDIFIPFANLNIHNTMIYSIKEYGYDKVKKLFDIAYSCENPNENDKPCGKCEKCKHQDQVFKEILKYFKKEFFYNKN